jgi:hypothetical protein
MLGCVIKKVWRALLLTYNTEPRMLRNFTQSLALACNSNQRVYELPVDFFALYVSYT